MNIPGSNWIPNVLHKNLCSAYDNRQKPDIGISVVRPNTVNYLFLNNPFPFTSTNSSELWKKTKIEHLTLLAQKSFPSGLTSSQAFSCCYVTVVWYTTRGTAVVFTTISICTISAFCKYHIIMSFRVISVFVVLLIFNDCRIIQNQNSVMFLINPVQIIWQSIYDFRLVMQEQLLVSVHIFLIIWVVQLNSVLSNNV